MKYEKIKSERLGEHYYVIKEKNIPDIYFFPKELSNIYALCAIKCGSLDNEIIVDGVRFNFPEGTAHFLEHKMFEGSGEVDIYEQFAKYGADANAYTSYDRTVYYFSCTENFAENLQILLDMVFFPKFTSQGVEKEKGIIAQEIIERNDSPEDICFFQLLKTLYKNNPIRNNIGGTVESINKVTFDILREYYNIFYHPENTAVIVCGNVNVECICDIVTQFASHAPYRFIERITPKETDNIVSKRVESSMHTSIPLFCIGYRYDEIVCDAEQLRRYDICLSILELMLFSTSGELYNMLYDSQMITSAFSDWHICDERVFMMAINGYAENPDEVCQYIMSYLKKQLSNGFSNDDFERCKRIVLADYITHFDSTEEIASSLITDAFDGVNVFDDGDIVQKISLEEITVFARKFFNEDRAAISIITPLENFDKEKGDN